MNRQTTRHSYQQRVETVVTYIANNLQQDLEVNQLAELAHFSPYHFHRIYREMMGEPVNVTVRRYRLHFAAHELISSKQSLLTIANNVRYSSAEAFGRAFAKAYGVTPAQYRQSRQHSCAVTEGGPRVASVHSANNLKYSEETAMYQVEIMALPQTPMIGLTHTGDYMQIGAKFDQLFMHAGSSGWLNEETRSLGLYYDDPKTVDETQLRSAACITVGQTKLAALAGEELEKFDQFLMPEGQYATVLFKGPYAELEKPYSWLFGEWLPKSGYEAGDFPPVEEYLNDPKDTAPDELLTRIHCLVQAS